MKSILEANLPIGGTSKIVLRNWKGGPVSMTVKTLSTPISTDALVEATVTEDYYTAFAAGVVESLDGVALAALPSGGKAYSFNAAEGDDVVVLVIAGTTDPLNLVITVG